MRTILLNSAAIATALGWAPLAAEFGALSARAARDHDALATAVVFALLGTVFGALIFVPVLVWGWL